MVDAVERAALDDLPRTRYLIGRGARLATTLPRLVPDRAWVAMTRRQVGLGRGSDARQPSP
ncbi:hypothetical protein [Arsenicicoccus sp. oral taxon 190]|uniref:hypothetical protein n=1 Tax=Arsenicicoccus sp. oral taxon 190 TaxID=1658671 RepID=UPI000679F2D5|nr:hypothetical protein [Arsenicicoccus sp. oral taxon 190]AKT52415.1 hypothetical protein ADJ73_16120 [Arsenicicoccus sp. oral taxon 190]